MTGSGSWQNISLDLSAYAGNSTVTIVFNYSDGGGWLYGIALDNITIESSGFLTIEEIDGQADEQYLGPMSTIHFTDPNTGNLIASIKNPTNHDYGCTEVIIDRLGLAGSAYPSPIAFNSKDSDNFVAAKTIEVTPEFNNTSGTFIITMYYTDEEMTALLKHYRESII